MTKQVMITLDQIENKGADMEEWKDIIEAVGRGKGDFNNPFPLSLILDLNGLDYAIWCFRCLPEYRNRYTKFALFCAKEVGMYIDDKAVHDCINTIEEYLEGNADLKALSEAHEAAVATAIARKLGGNSVACVAAQATASAAKTILADDYTDAVFLASDGAFTTYCLANVHVTNACTFREADKAQRQNQTDYLRKLLDGED